MLRQGTITTKITIIYTCSIYTIDIRWNDKRLFWAQYTIIINILHWIIYGGKKDYSNVASMVAILNKQKALASFLVHH